MSPPVGLGLGVLDLEHAANKYKEGEGSLADVAVAAPGALPGVAGKLPKLRGAYHGTSSVDDFTKFVKSQRDMGTHISTDPNVARGYAMGDYSPNKFLYDWATLHNVPLDIPVAGPRTIPVVADIRNPVKYPGDPVNWQKPENVLETLESEMMGKSYSKGMPYPSLLADLERVEGKSGKWEQNFYDYLKNEKGFDAVQYPHMTRGQNIGAFNSFMALDPEQVVPRLSPEGQALIKERGVTKPSVSLTWNPMSQAYWDLKNQGIIGKEALDILKGKGLLTTE